MRSQGVSAEQLRRRSHLPVDEPTGDGIAVFASTADRLSAVAEVAALDETVGPMTEVVTAQGGPLRVAVGSGDRAGADVADLLARALSDAGVGEVIRYRAGPSIGLHVGAGTVGAFFHPV